MQRIIYLPLEHIDMRYTVYLDRIITDYLDKNNYDYIKVYPNIEKREIKDGSFLDAPTTIEFKSKQIAEISKMYYNNTIRDGDIIFTSDIWFPGIESIAYLNYFTKKNVKLRGFLHAGSFTDTDFVRDMERWAKNFEDMVFDITDKVFVASNFIKNDVIKKRIINEDKLIVTGLPLDKDNYIKYRQNAKENIVIFNGRNVDEKQPWLFDELEKKVVQRYGQAIKGFKFINTHKNNYSKDDYYELLGKSKVVVSFALQENFGIGINEAVELGCIPILPNRLVYTEFYSKEYLYTNFTECVDMVVSALEGELEQTSPNYYFDITKWFK
tara:strand:+ start:9112 stop:10089 length:978 start_codon:yes stop_codon:yes gene_type:complete